MRLTQLYKCNDAGTGNRKRYEKSTQHRRHQKSSWSFGKVKPRGKYNINMPRDTKWNNIIIRSYTCLY